MDMAESTRWQVCKRAMASCGEWRLSERITEAEKYSGAGKSVSEPRGLEKADQMQRT
jgi:hypothetical protein